MRSIVLAAAAFITVRVSAQCVTGRYYFDQERIYNPGKYISAPPVPDIDTSKYDFTVDYGDIKYNDNLAQLNLVKNGDSVANGARISMTHYIHYGKITVRMRAPADAGVISTFITMSDVKDEIDYEMLGAYPDEAQTVVFYRGIPEVTVHGGIHKFPNHTTMDTFHDYTIDWQPDVLKWYIDDVLVRTLVKEESISPRTPAGKRWYPDTPSIVQLAIWDGGSSANKGTSEWAGGKIPWNGRNIISAEYAHVDIQCNGDVFKPPTSTTTKKSSSTSSASSVSASTTTTSKNASSTTTNNVAENIPTTSNGSSADESAQDATSAAYSVVPATLSYVYVTLLSIVILLIL